MTPEKFIEYVRNETAKASVKFNLVDKKTVGVEGNVRVNGFFDEDELTVATKKPIEEWFPILVHEYSHFLQWKDNCQAWRRSIINGEDICDTLFLWIKKKKRYPLDIVKLHAARTRDVEVDCEKKAIGIIKEFKLGWHIESLFEPRYIMQANSYLYFYNYAFLKRRWWRRSHSPYNNPDVWCNFPPFFKKSYTQLPKRYVELYDKYC